MRSIVVLMLLAIGAVTAAADECRELAHAKRAHVFIVVEVDGPVFGYAELIDVRQAWRRSRTNWTPTVQGESVEDVRAKLARLMRDDVIGNPEPPEITHDIFGETVDWGDRDRLRKAWWNVDQWAPPPAKPSWRRKWETLPSRD